MSLKNYGIQVCLKCRFTEIHIIVWKLTIEG